MGLPWYLILDGNQKRNSYFRILFKVLFLISIFWAQLNGGVWFQLHFVLWAVMILLLWQLFLNFSKLSSSTLVLSAIKVSSFCLSSSPGDPPSTPTCSPPAPPPPPSLSHSFANLSLLLLLLTHHKCTCTPFLLNVVPQSISCGLISNFATGFQNSLFALIQTFTKVVNSDTMGREDHLVSFYHCMPGSHQLCHWHLWVL